MVLNAAVVACLAQQARGQQIGADAVPASADSGDAEPASADSEDSVPASADAGDAGMVTQQHCAQQAAACAAAGEEAEQRPPAVLDAAADARAAVAQGSSAGDGGWLSVFQRSMRDALDSSWTKKGLRVSELCGIEPCSHYSAQTALDGLLATASAAASSIQVAGFLAGQHQDLPSPSFLWLYQCREACSQQALSSPLCCTRWACVSQSLRQTNS